MFKQKSRVQILVQQFSSSFGLPFEKILPQAVIEETLEEEKLKYRERLYSPIVTLWAFLSQVLDKDKTCHNAVSRIIAWLAAKGEKIPSQDNSGYCQARLRLPENFVKKLVKKSGENLEKEVQKDKLWCGRHVKVFDGSTVSIEVTLITTLLDAEIYPIKELLKIYELRWNVELNLRHIKTSLGMDILRGKTPEMVRKEIYVHLLAYNLLRTVMWQAGNTHNLDCLRLSLQEARHHFHNFISEIKDVSLNKRQKISQIMLEIIAHKPLKKRVGRFEPRVKKRRPKSYPLMQEPRSILKQKIA